MPLLQTVGALGDLGGVRHLKTRRCSTNSVQQHARVIRQLRLACFAISGKFNAMCNPNFMDAGPSFLAGATGSYGPIREGRSLSRVIKTYSILLQTWEHMGREPPGAFWMAGSNLQVQQACPPAKKKSRNGGLTV